MGSIFSNFLLIFKCFDYKAHLVYDWLTYVLYIISALDLFQFLYILITR